MKKIIKKILLFFGLRVSRISPGSLGEKNRYKWIKALNINTVIDVGSSKGNASRQFHEIFPNALIYAFEPLSDCFELTKKKMAGVSGFRAFNVALSDVSGNSMIFRSSYSGASSLLKMGQLQKDIFPHVAGEKIEPIKTDTLDNILANHNLVDNILIKMDVQGFEGKVIKGGLNIFRRAKIVITETSFQILYEGQPLFGDIYRQLSELGYRYVGAWGNNGDFKSPIDGLPLQQDSIFIKE